MYRIFVVFLSVFLVTACDLGAPEQSSEESPSKKSQAANEHDGHDHEGHSHSMAASGEQYKEIEPKDACATPTVIEFFAYQCPHCYQLESHAKTWKASKPDNVEFKAVPTTLGREQFLPLLATHHVANRLDILEPVKADLFALIHEQKGNGNLLELLTNAGAESAQAEQYFQDSEQLNAVISEDFELMKRYQVTSVPAILVNYQYMIDISSAGGYDKVFPLVDELLNAPAKCESL